MVPSSESSIHLCPQSKEEPEAKSTNVWPCPLAVFEHTSTQHSVSLPFPLSPQVLPIHTEVLETWNKHMKPYTRPTTGHKSENWKPLIVNVIYLTFSLGTNFFSFPSFSSSSSTLQPFIYLIHSIHLFHLFLNILTILFLIHLFLAILIINYPLVYLHLPSLLHWQLIPVVLEICCWTTQPNQLRESNSS